MNPESNHTSSHRMRLATLNDAREMLEIYRPFITESAISFEYEVPSETEFQTRISNHLAFAPWYVYEVDGKIAGYAYASKHRERAAYRWAVESSIYLHPKFQRLGIGRKLYEKLFSELEQQGFHLVLAGITLPHPQSVHFHESLGFAPVGIYKRIGFKFGQWHDVGWWQKNLKPTTESPTI